MTRRSRSFVINRPELVPILHELMPVGGGADPLSVLAWPGPGAFLKKVVAEYPNGWRLIVHLKRNGEVLSCTAQYKLKAEIRGKAGTVIVDELAG